MTITCKDLRMQNIPKPADIPNDPYCVFNNQFAKIYITSNKVEYESLLSHLENIGYSWYCGGSKKKKLPNTYIALYSDGDMTTGTISAISHDVTIYEIVVPDRSDKKEIGVFLKNQVRHHANRMVEASERNDFLSASMEQSKVMAHLKSLKWMKKMGMLKAWTPKDLKDAVAMSVDGFKEPDQ